MTGGIQMKSFLEKTGKWILFFLLLAAVVVLICYYAAQSKETVDVIYICKTEISSSDFWASVLSGAEMAAKENQVNLKIKCSPDELNVEMQNDLIYESIAEKPDVIAVSVASRDANTQALRAVKEAGIGLIIIDSKADEDIQDCVVTTDNIAAGRKMAEPMLPKLTPESKIAIVAHVENASTCVERIEGLLDGLGSYRDQVVDIVYSNAIADIGYKVTLDLLKREPDISFIACTNEDSAVGAARAVQELGLEKDILMVGFDSSQEEVVRLEEGVLDAIVVQKAFSMGYFGIESAAALARNEHIEHYIDSGSVLITKDNMYQEENQEVLFPFHD